MNRRAALAALLALSVSLTLIGVGCSGEDTSGPPDIKYGRDVCEQCHMIISEPRYAAAYRNASGKAFKFDDIGDMVTHAVKAGESDGKRAWVHDYKTEEWIAAGDAWFVRSPDIQTPMGGGIIAFTKQNEAEQFVADEGGKLLRWSELIKEGSTLTNDQGDHSGSETHSGP